MKSEFEIAKILKPRGLKGEMKVEFYSSDVARFSHLKAVRINDVFYDIVKIIAEGDYGYITLSGVDSVEEAEKLRGQMVFATRADLPEPDGDKHYIVDMIGLDVIVGEKCVGKLKDVLQYGAADVYVVKSANGTLSFPAIKPLIKSVDIAGGKLTLDEAVFNSVVVYD